MRGLTFTPFFGYLLDTQMDTLTSLKGNFALIIAWFGASVTALVFASLFLVFLSSSKVYIPQTSTYQLYAALPPHQVETQDGVTSSDGRVKALEEFFKRYKSVLVNQADTFIEVADKYGLDWRLLPSISMQESNGARRMIPSSNNPFGYGIYGDKVLKFESFENAIETVGKGLKENYISQGLTTPETIMTKYTPPSVALGGPWAKGVQTFMEELK